MIHYLYKICQAPFSIFFKNKTKQKYEQFILVSVKSTSTSVSSHIKLTLCRFATETVFFVFHYLNGYRSEIMNEKNMSGRAKSFLKQSDAK